MNGAVDEGEVPLLDGPLFMIGRHRMPVTPLDRTFLTRRAAARNLILVRHGQQELPSASRSREDFYDPPLSELGVRQAAAVARMATRYGLEAVYSSDLVRARQTAEAVADACGLTVSEELPELREIDMYRDLATAEDSMRPSDGWRAGLPAVFMRTRRWGAYPYGETSEAFRARVATSIEGILALNPGANVAVVAHGGVIGAYVSELLGVSQDMVFQPAHCSLTWIRHAPEGRREIHSLNLVEHLFDADLLSY